MKDVETIEELTYIVILFFVGMIAIMIIDRLLPNNDDDDEFTE